MLELAHLDSWYVGLYIDGRTSVFLNETQELDYFGSIDDVAVVSVKEFTTNEIRSHVVGGGMVETPVDQIIEDVIVITDMEYMSKDGTDLYRYYFTVAIAFVLSDRQIVFERDCWFSEDFLIYRDQGLSSALLQNAVIRSRFVADNIGAKVLVVDPLTPELEGFYERFGFRRIADTGMMAARL